MASRTRSGMGVGPGVSILVACMDGMATSLNYIVLDAYS